MERYIFVIREDEEHLDDFFTWIKKLLSIYDAPTKTDGTILFRLVQVTHDFTQVYLPHALCQWMNYETLKQCMVDKTPLKANSMYKQELEDYLHETIDSLPYTGSSVHMYNFLHVNDLECNDGFVSLTGVVLRLKKWHHARISVVMMDSKLSDNGDRIVSLTNCKSLSIREHPQPAQVSWTGEVTVVDNVRKEGLVFPNFLFKCPKWNLILKQGFSPTFKRQMRKRGRKEEMESIDLCQSRPVCGQRIEVLQEVDLTTFPLFLLTPWTFELCSFCDTGTGNILVEYLQGKSLMGLLARLQVYPRSAEIPQCGETVQRSTSAWKEFVLTSSSSTSSDTEIDNSSDPLPSSFEYLHLLILPNCGLSSSTEKANNLQVRVLLRAKQFARNILSVIRNQNSVNHGETIRPCKKEKEDDEVKKCLNSLPVFKVEELYSTLKLFHDCQENLPEDLEKRETWLQEAALKMENIFKEIPRPKRTIGDELQALQNEAKDSMSEAVYGLSKCPEWIALMAESGKQNGTQNSSFSDMSTSSTLHRRKSSFDKSESGEFSIGNILSLFKGEGAAKEGLRTPVKNAESSFFPFRRQSDSSFECQDNEPWRQHDMYHYNTEADYDSEVKYAQIRDRGNFQDTQSSFVTPKKKASKQFDAIVPVRSSPRTKPVSRKRTLSQSLKELPESKPTFKLPQSVQSSANSQRKWPASSLTPDSERRRPMKYSHSASSPSLLSSSAPENISPFLMTSNKQICKRVPFTTVMESSDPTVRRSPRKLPRSNSGLAESSKSLKQKDSNEVSFESSKQGSDQSTKMKRSERHMMRLKSIIANVLKEKGVTKEEPIYDACSKNLLNVSIILLKTLPNSQNLTDEMKSVVYEQVQQIINLEKRRSGIAL